MVYFCNIEWITFTPTVNCTTVHTKQTPDHLFKHTSHTNRTNWTMVTNRLWSAPKALVWKHPRDTNRDLFQFTSFLWLASWFLICILIAKCLNEIGQPYGLYSKTGEVYNLRRVMKEREESGTAMRGSMVMKEWEVHLSIVCLFKLIDFTKVKSQQWLLTETTCSAANLLVLSSSL